MKCSKYVVHVPPNRGPPSAHARVSLVSSAWEAVGVEPSQRLRSTALSEGGSWEAAHVPRAKPSDIAGDRRLSARPDGDGLRAVFAYNLGSNQNRTLWASPRGSRRTGVGGAGCPITTGHASSLDLTGHRAKYCGCHGLLAGDHHASRGSGGATRFWGPGPPVQTSSGAVPTQSHVTHRAPMRDRRSAVP